MKRSVLFCLGIFLSGNAFAGCDWATTTPKDDANYKYFVARVYSQNNMSDAQAKAEQEINNQICRLFGAETITSTEYYSDTTIATGTSRTNERCVGVRLQQFIKEKSDTERSGNEYIACVKYKYAQTAYKAETKRIVQTTKGVVAGFNESIGDTNCPGAPVEFAITPQDALIFIDGEPYGKVSLIKNVCRGKHKLRITHDNYEPVEEDLIVPLANGTITKTLKRATKKITISASDPRATIKVNNKNIGKTPVTYTPNLGDTIQIEASADGTISATRTLLIDKYSDDKIILDLDAKPVKIDFSGWKQQYPGWDVYVDGTKIDTHTKITPNEPHDIKFTRDGYRTIRDTYSHSPTDKVVYFDKTYNIVPTKSMSRQNGLNIDFLSGIGGDYISADTNDKTTSAIGLSFDMLALRIRKDAFYSRIGFNYDLVSVSNGNFKISKGFNTDANLGVNFGDYVSVFGILGYENLNITRPQINGKDFSGSMWNFYQGIGLEYNMQSWPCSIRLKYTIASVDLYKEFYIGNKNTRIHNIGLSFNINWSGLLRMMQ